jgi:hypothetical protein
MTLINKAEAINGVLELVRDSERTQEKLGRAHDTASSLDPIVEDLVRITEGVNELRTSELAEVPNEFISRCNELLGRFQEVDDELRSNLMAHVERDYRDLIQSARELCIEAKAWASSAWSQAIEGENLPKVNTDLVNDLERAGLDVEDIQNAVVTAQSDLMILQSRPLPKHGDHEKLLRLRANMQRAVELLQTRLPDAVAEFIVAAARPHGAELALLTQAVFDFLVEHDIDTRYGIRIR